MFVSIIDLKSNILLFRFSICGIYLWLVPLFVRFTRFFSFTLLQSIRVDSHPVRNVPYLMHIS